MDVGLGWDVMTGDVFPFVVTFSNDACRVRARVGVDAEGPGCPKAMFGVGGGGGRCGSGICTCVMLGTGSCVMPGGEERYWNISVKSSSIE